LGGGNRKDRPLPRITAHVGGEKWVGEVVPAEGKEEKKPWKSGLVVLDEQRKNVGVKTKKAKKVEMAPR